MSETRERAAPRAASPFDMGMQFPTTSGAENAIAPMQAGSASDRAAADIITAQRVSVKRDVSGVLRDARVLATAAGRDFFYSIPFIERQDDGTERIKRVEGPTIGCTMAAVSCYGNCRVEAFPAKETQTHWTFMARFTDYEKGVTIIRSFNQRKGQNVGIKDRGRSEDIVFQIGQSKAMRNVVVAALPWLCNDMFAAAKIGVLSRIEASPDAAREWLLARYAEADIEVKRVERIMARTADKWLATDMAKLFSEWQAIRDGMADADELYPPLQGGKEAPEANAGAKVPPDKASADDPKNKPATKKVDPAPAAGKPDDVANAVADAEAAAKAAFAREQAGSQQAQARANELHSQQAQQAATNHPADDDDPGGGEDEGEISFE